MSPTELFVALPSRVQSIGRLAADVGVSDTTITLAAAVPATLQGTGQFRIMIDSEIMIVSNATSSTTLNVTRGAEGTAAAAHNGTAAPVANVFFVLTAGAMQNIAPAAHAASHEIGGGDRLHPGDLGDFFDIERVSEVGTMHWLQAVSVLTLTSGVAYGAVARARTAGTFSKIRCYFDSATPSITDFRLGVHDSTGAVIAQTANVAASVAANNALPDSSLGSSVTLTENQRLFLSLCAVGTTPPTVKGAALRPAMTDSTHGQRTRSASGIAAGGSIPNLGTTAVGNVPLIELLP